MSTVIPSPEQTTPQASPPMVATPSQPSRPQRVLACTLCQQRKIKCDRKFPCTNCIKSRVQCVPSTLTPRQRRRRYPERMLLERLRKYETMLHQNNIDFEPLHNDSAREKDYSNADGDDNSDDERPGATEADVSSTSVISERTHEAKNFWDNMNKNFQEPTDNSPSSYDQLFPDNDHLLLGARQTTVDLSTLHPEPVQIFRLWQAYLDNVNPLLKVTHSPSLQPRIVEAVGKLTNISPNLEALMFGIYCMAVISLAADDCQIMFGSSREDLLTVYRFACQEALFNCRYLRTGDLDCLTALYLYLLSVGPSTDPRSLSSMLGVAIRIARRMGIHSESANAKCTILDAEMRRRVWWSLFLFDTRIGELADPKSSTATLSPTFDCSTPRNVDDSELRLESRELPAVEKRSTEAIFVVVRSELANFVRQTTFYREFTSSALTSVAKDSQQALKAEGGELASLEKIMEEKHLRLCDPDNSLHFLTIWTTRYHIARYRLLELYWKDSVYSVATTDLHDTTLSVAFTMLESDTNIMGSPLTKGYRWLFTVYFPFPAYVHIIQHLTTRPLGEQAERAWKVISDNFEARSRFTSTIISTNHNPVFITFFNSVLDAWQAREAAIGQIGELLDPPPIVTHVRSKLAENTHQTVESQLPFGFMDMGVDELSMSMPLGFGSPGLRGTLRQGGFSGMWPAAYPDLSASMDGVDMNSSNWAPMDWGLLVNEKPLDGAPPV